MESPRACARPTLARNSSLGCGYAGPAGLVHSPRHSHLHPSHVARAHSPSPSRVHAATAAAPTPHTPRLCRVRDLAVSAAQLSRTSSTTGHSLPATTVAPVPVLPAVHCGLFEPSGSSDMALARGASLPMTPSAATGSSIGKPAPAHTRSPFYDFVATEAATAQTTAGKANAMAPVESAGPVTNISPPQIQYAKPAHAAAGTQATAPTPAAKSAFTYADLSSMSVVCRVTRVAGKHITPAPMPATLDLLLDL